MTESATSAPTASALPARLSRGARGPTVSFELYPPRSARAEASLWVTLAHLERARPDFFSVTYGASGSSRETSRGVVRWILEHTDVPPVAHLTCLGAPTSDVRSVAERLVRDGVRDFLALRGDPPAQEPEWVPDPHGLHRASQLVELLREVEAELLPVGEPLSVAVAASPASLRPPTSDGELCGDLRALVAKQEAGADYAITQVFFQAQTYVDYVAAARDAGVRIPLVPGIVPLADPRRLRRLEEISGVGVPTRVLAALEAEPDEERMRAAGRAMGAELALAVLEAGAPGLHVYTFNTHTAAVDLLEAARLRELDGDGKR